MANEDKRIVIAGSIGCYAGGCLALAGRRVILLARPHIEEAMRKDELRITGLDGRDRSIKPDGLSVTADPAVALRGAEIILVTVKSGATEAIAALIVAHALVRKAEQERRGSPGLTSEAIMADGRQ
ncbi:2-dehydropantoate 2-reductase N-terminal domain-containing protein [Mesorhizobium sp. M1322]|uniref:2-dehydropantoate 2-reductase N-terminal domain-containing protein n=1 Tax=Mesorhizobium sp. M1322 TaxID=2957081 RepID=UPI00333D89BE